jgi:hypothetical protein
MKIYQRLPKGYELHDPARNFKSAVYLRKSAPKSYKAVIVKTYLGKGTVFPYHIAKKQGID